MVAITGRPCRRAVHRLDGDLAEPRQRRDSRPRLGVRWLHGPGGQGKSRIAARLAAGTVAAGWRVIAAFHGPDAGTSQNATEAIRGH
ncbi:hypothetical protein Dvina_17570 [Dactylosporangium vinaceum]|uniref:ATP-binding protein n=1 Tax=Dactylosporangium vinaceum TaxID=53362 RepID=A0ABV5M3D0_9ACTN|nr:hypothetical protein [Dactylosporangium vinaceum]UAB99710.1 hypothetical protein Dvina_17570 [Dactylosporangium vinaceum]